MAEHIVYVLADALPAPSVVSIGFFDGVHRGHQTIIRRAVRRASDLGLRSVVVTFDRHPMEVVNPGSQPELLMTSLRRAQMLAAQQVDLVVVLPFDDTLRHLPPDEFVDHVLVDPLRAVEVIVGTNFRYGHKAAGDVATLTDAGRARGFRTEGVSLLSLDGVAISSTEIRAAVDAGEVERAGRMLGRPHFVDGVVVRGDQRGTGLGFPTANLQVDPRLAVPARGVYAGMFQGPGNEVHAAVTNVGINPTFGGSQLRVEAHLLDAHPDLYGVTAAVDFRHRLRDERRFDSVDDLVTQMGRDRNAARRLLAQDPGDAG
ncbi:MAG: bifunctional riboflavin kinase/FAD synthetase [Nitriliruptorales bacterium]|nr:bifunctional riboflavin kinase/FAD synthetase [Nitriliruptorales bacterium]